MLQVAEIDSRGRPTLDGDLSDPAWTKAKPVFVLTTQGGDFGGTRQSQVEIRALHDGEHAYFAFVWEDPTRSLKHLPLVKRGGRWRDRGQPLRSRRRGKVSRGQVRRAAGPARACR